MALEGRCACGLGRREAVLVAQLWCQWWQRARTPGQAELNASSGRAQARCCSWGCAGVTWWSWSQKEFGFGVRVLISLGVNSRHSLSLAGSCFLEGLHPLVAELSEDCFEVLYFLRRRAWAVSMAVPRAHAGSPAPHALKRVAALSCALTAGALILRCYLSKVETKVWNPRRAGDSLTTNSCSKTIKREQVLLVPESLTPNEMNRRELQNPGQILLLVCYSSLSLSRSVLPVFPTLPVICISVPNLIQAVSFVLYIWYPSYILGPYNMHTCTLKGNTNSL